MKSAKEMFEGLGYEYSVEDDRCGKFIDYWVEEDETDNWYHIRFNISSKTYYADEGWGKMHIDMPTFKAIQKQLEELGWL